MAAEQPPHAGLDEDSDRLGPSKSERKRQALALQALGKALVELPAAELATLPLSQTLRELVVATRPLTRGALKRQLKFLGAQLRHEDVDAVRAALATRHDQHRTNVMAFKTLELWRDRLIAGDDAVIEDIVGRLAGADRQHLRQLARNARNERSREQPPRAARALFKYLAGLPDA